MGGCGMVLGLALASPFGGATSASKEDLCLYVSLDGDDESNGLRRRFKYERGGPLRTPQAALRKIREMRAQDPSLRERDVTIALDPGVWYLDAPLEIGPDD